MTFVKLMGRRNKKKRLQRIIDQIEPNLTLAGFQLLSILRRIGIFEVLAPSFHSISLSLPLSVSV